jgi:hypothetical protein
VLVLGLGCLTHPLVDPTNTYPQTLFWPLFGTGFPHSHQDYRSYFQIPLNFLLFAVYSVAVWRSERWRVSALEFAWAGAFPFQARTDAGRDVLPPPGGDVPTEGLCHDR